MTTSRRTDRLQRARAKARKIRDDLQVARGELHLSNAVLDRKLDAEQKKGDAGRALAQTEAVARKVGQAEDELKEVENLIQQEDSAPDAAG